MFIRFFVVFIFGKVCLIVSIKGVIFLLFLILIGILFFKSFFIELVINLLVKFDIIKRCKIELLLLFLKFLICVLSSLLLL